MSGQLQGSSACVKGAYLTPLGSGYDLKIHQSHIKLHITSQPFLINNLWSPVFTNIHTRVVRS